MPGDRSQYGIVSFSGKDDGDLVPLESYFPFSFYKESMDLGGIAAFKSPKPPSGIALSHIQKGFYTPGSSEVGWSCNRRCNQGPQSPQNAS